MKNEINPTAGSSNSDEDIFRYLFYNALNPTAGSSNLVKFYLLMLKMVNFKSHCWKLKPNGK